MKLIATSTSGWVAQILMRRETGPGLTEPHSTTQSGLVVRVQVALHRTALLWTHTTPHPTTGTGLTLNVLTHIPIFVKLTLITNKDKNSATNSLGRVGE